MQNFNNILRTTYPLTFSRMGEELWTEFVHGFKSQEPLVEENIFSLIEFEKQVDWGQTNDIPWLHDSLMFEFLKFDLSTKARWTPVELRSFNESLNEVLILHNELEIIRLEYQIHADEFDTAEYQKGTYFLLLYRDQDDLTIKPIEITPFLAVLTEQLILQNDTVNDILEYLLTQNEITPTKEIFDFCEEYVIQLASIQIVKGIQ